MHTRIALSVCLFVTPACISIDYSEELFACSTDADCDAAEGYVCAGLELDGAEAQRYCVTGGKRQLSFQMKTTSPFIEKDLTSPSQDCAPVDGDIVKVELRFAIGDDDLDDVTAADPDDELPEGVTCDGEASTRGTGTFTCTLRYDSEYESAGMAVALVAGPDAPASAGVEGSLVALAFKKIAIKRGKYFYDLGTADVFDLDIAEPHLGDNRSDRCLQRASIRHDLCGYQGLDACDCDPAAAQDTCPEPYYCTADGECWQEGDRAAGEACLATIQESCASGTCTTNQCE